jgi:hypothetical protein
VRTAAISKGAHKAPPLLFNSNDSRPSRVSRPACCEKSKAEGAVDVLASADTAQPRRSVRLRASDAFQAQFTVPVGIA